MYKTADLLPVEGIPDGTVLLCSGPTMVGKRDLLLRLLAQGIDQGERPLLLTTDESAESIQRELTALAAQDPVSAGLAVVDTSGVEAADGETPPHVKRLASPTDLTGVGIGLSNVLGGGARKTRIGFLSLSTMLLYTDAERVMRLLHVFGRRVQEAGAVAFVLVHDDALDPEIASQLQAFVDGAIELRERDGTTEYRVRGFSKEAASWRTMPAFESITVASSGDDSAPTDQSTESPDIDSLAALIRGVAADRPTLTIVNYTGDETALERIESYFRRIQVPVRTTRTEVDSPIDVALLHRGDDLLASASVLELEAGIAVEDEGSQDQAMATTPLLEAVDHTIFDTAGADKRRLIQISHTIEMQANRAASGRIHAGFQQLSRLQHDTRARRIYERIADRGVDVHIYGDPDVSVRNDDWTVHEATTDELRGTWFVGFTDPGARPGVLVAEEHGTGYDGFWSYRRDLAEQLDGYLDATYGD